MHAQKNLRDFIHVQNGTDGLQKLLFLTVN